MRPVALIGFMAAGKSTIGKALALQLEIPYVDTDDEVVRLQGQTPGQIIRQSGEEHFRHCEQAALAGLIDRDYPFICATGGGIITYEPSRQLLSRHFQVIWLRIKPETALLRIQEDNADRPLSQAENPLQHILRLLESRSPFYERTAHFIIDVDDTLPVEIVSQIKKHL